MRIVERIFDACLIIEPTLREDNRGVMEVFYSPVEMKELMNGFEAKEQRMYKMPKKHTFFGIHYQNPGKAKGKLISIIQGRGLDYLVDLRKESPTYKQYKMFELCEERPLLVFVPAGFGHAFLSTEENTIQAFAIDVNYDENHSGGISYKSPGIDLHLPVNDEDLVISSYDKDAVYLS